MKMLIAIVVLTSAFAGSVQYASARSSGCIPTQATKSSGSSEWQRSNATRYDNR